MNESLITEELIDEGIIPQGFSWRAGINTERPVPVQQSGSFPSSISNMPPEMMMYQQKMEYGMVTDSPINYCGDNKSFTVQPPQENIPQKPVSTPEFRSSLNLELDTMIDDISNEFKDKDLGVMTTFDIKNRIKERCHGYMSKFRQFIDQDCIDSIYNYCNSKYYSFQNIDPSVNAFSEVIRKDGKLYINPMLIYQYFQV